MDPSPSGYLSIAEKQNQHHSYVALSISDDANPAQEYPEPRTTPTRSALLAAALGYARRGLPVFPCRPGEKRPSWAKGVLENGHLNATTDPQTITAWWNRWPQANTGMPTGKPSGIVVVDLDVHKDGAWTLEELEENLGPLGDYMLVRSGSGGLQLWYLRPEGELRNGIPEDVMGPGVCIKGDGGYVVVAPSVTSGPYEVLRGKPGPCPGWLDEALRDMAGVSVPKGADQPMRSGGSGKPAPLGRNVALTSICGSLHDGTRDLPALTAALAAVRDERWPDFPDAEVAKIARSIHRREPCKPQGKRAPGEVQRWLMAFEERMEAATWGGKAYFRLSLLKTYVMLARSHGELREDGVALSISNTQTALHNGCSDRAVRRNNAKLVEEGLIATDNGDRAPTESGTIVLLIPLSERLDNPTEPRCVLTHTHLGRVVGEEGERQAAACGGGLGHIAAPAAWSATRARHGKPLFDRGELVDFLGRMGPRAEQAVDLLEEAGGRLTPEDLAGAMGIKRSRNMRASVWYARLLDARVVERDSEGYLYLTADWLAAWDRRRVEDEEEMDRLRDQERYKRMSEAWALRVDEHAEGLHQRRLDREALACFDGEIPPEADGLIGELEPVEEGAHGPEDVPEGSEEVQEPVRTPVESSRRSGDGLSELARKLRVYLTLCPHRAHEKPSWLANYAWSESLVGWKPTPEEVAEALSELERVGRKEAA